MENSLVEALTTARNSLTPETWRKGAYFKVDNNILCMCAHGAVQAIVNPSIKEKLTPFKCHLMCVDGIGIVQATRAPDIEINRPLLGYVSANGGSAAVVAEYDRGKTPRTLLSKIWNNRSSWIRQHTSTGNLDAHYLLGLVGLTISFNDHPDTTLEMVHQKFDEAIELAREIQ